ncbi:hypothetical protein [Bdellovibrio svalbardensis]|uniref:FUSC family protein n=1 Tax=Bdellovibrio svalbardensis TaxID=2972972 RepID=A0ABT6DIR0_9BACT|nr:hypothetical protein [Bdellovibrio svalbardensis]MDG0816743.1 hypothetical protein [Bdellovibrio svalbardensis]
MSDVRPQNVLENWLFTSLVTEDDQTRTYKYRLLVMITFVTGLLMWTYSFVATFFVKGSALAIIGFTCSIIHLFSPLIYKKTKSMAASAYNMVIAGIVFQFSFAFFTGGFFSATLIWLAVLPMIVGILTNKTHAIVWTLISTSGVLLMFYLHQEGLCPQDSLSELGKVMVQFLAALGLISLIGGFTLFFIELSYFYSNRSQIKSNLDP